MTLREINALPALTVQHEFVRCCGSTVWATLMVDRRPFQNEIELQDAAESNWWSLSEKEWLEAFFHHPKIGARKVSTPWSAAEQTGISRASEATLEEMTELNNAYERKFGWIFIVCATGKTADQMRALLKDRLANEAGKELRIAATEHAKITRLRLEKLLAE